MVAAGQRIWVVGLVREGMDCSRSLMGLDREIAEDGGIDECVQFSVPSSGLGVIDIIQHKVILN